MIRRSGPRFFVPGETGAKGIEFVQDIYNPS